jgi:cephalosporin hydroxylase
MTIKKFLRPVKKELTRLKNIIYNRIYINSKAENSITDRFHKLYYEAANFGKSWENTLWLGVANHKCPLDLWVYQEIIYELKPEVIIETGTYHGGSALFLASICDLVDEGEVLSIDIEEKGDRPAHKRVRYLLGSSTSCEVIDKVKRLIEGKAKVMVILDSDHSKDHVLSELKIYSQFVTKGSYLIVEDTNLNGHPVEPEFGPGPMEAVEEFLKENTVFTIDKGREKFYLTFNPNGYLRKIR